MPRIEFVEYISARPQAVWDFISDIRRAPEWLTVSQEVLFVSNEPIKKGNVYRERTLIRDFVFGPTMVLVVLFSLGMLLIIGAPLSREQSAARAVSYVLGKTFVVTSTADSGSGTLRQALLDAQSGDAITFDPAVFPPSAPVTVSLTSALPDINQGDLTVDASNVGVILDGSNIGSTPEMLLLDDVRFTLNGGANLIINGDYTAGLVHWRPWDENSGATRSLNSGDFTSSPNSYAWSTVAHAYGSRTVYDTSDTSDPITEWPYSIDSTVWISATGGSTSEWRFWYKGGQVTVRLYALFADDHTEGVGEWWFDWQTDWTEAVVSQVLPANTIGVALELQNNHSEAFTNGLNVHSDGNTIRGLQIANFPDVGIALGNGARDNTLESNLVYNNGSRGIGLWGASFNTIQGNIIGTNAGGTAALGNRGSGIFVTQGGSDNRIGPDNVSAYNGVDGIEVFGPDALRNTITQNSVYDNDHMGIELWSGGNKELAAPLVFDFDLNTGSIAGTACFSCTVEIFSDIDNEGKHYEGRTIASSLGAFVFDKEALFTGPYLTVTATDIDGNTSQFSLPTTGTHKSAIIQVGNSLPRFHTQTKSSEDLLDNRIGDMFVLQFDNESPHHFVNRINDHGLKWMRVSIDTTDWSDVAQGKAGYSAHYIDPEQDAAITGLVEKGVKIMYCLVFWDEELGIPEPGHPRFASQEEIDRYLDYVRFLVDNLKDRVEYFEIFNEPDYSDSTSSQQNIRVADYIELVRQAVPVIREEYPQVKIVVGATGLDEVWRNYLFGILESDVMPLVDAISWHTGPQYSPAYTDTMDYYYTYPSVVQQIRDTAVAHGFAGEFIAEEMHWRHPDDQSCDPCHPWTHSYIKGAKYLARSIVMHLGIDTAAGLAEHLESVPKEQIIENLSTLMAGAEPISLTVSIQSVATDTVSYSFVFSNGDHLVAVWRDNVAVEEDVGISATLIVTGLTASTVVGIDVLNGFQQEMVTSVEDGALVIRNLLVRDYPLVFRISPMQYIYLPIALKDNTR